MAIQLEQSPLVGRPISKTCCPSEAVPPQDHWQWKSTTDKASRGHFGRRDNSQQSPSWLYGRQR